MTVIEDFEVSSLSAEWTIDNASLNNNRAYNGSKSLKIFNGVGATTQATFNADELSGGNNPDKLIFYWNETSGSFGGGLRVKDSAGNVVTGFATNNPQWDVLTGSNSFSTLYGGDGYDRWIKITMDFDFSNNQVTVSGEDLQSGSTASDTYGFVNYTDNIEELEFREYAGGSWGSSSTEMWFDDLTLEGLQATTVSLGTIDSIEGDGATYNASFDTTESLGNVDLEFNIYDNSGTLLENVFVESIDTANVTLPYSYSYTDNSRDKGTTYEVEAQAVDTSASNTFTSSTKFYTTLGDIVTIEDFEVSSLSNEWTLDNATLSTQYANRFSKSLNITGGTTTCASFIPSELSGGKQATKLRFYWYETSSQQGGGLRVKDSAGNVVTGFASDNPEWYVQTASSTFEQLYNGDGYDRWIRVDLDFKYSTDVVTIEVEDLKTGTVKSNSYPFVNSASDIETLEFREYNSDSWGNSDTNMWFDDIQISGVSALYQRLNKIEKVDEKGAVFEAIFSTTDDLGSLDLEFDVLDTNSNVVSNTVVNTVDTANKRFPVTYTFEETSLNDDTTYNVLSSVESSSNDYETGTRQFTTKKIYSGSIQTRTETTASDSISSGNIIDRSFQGASDSISSGNIIDRSFQGASSSVDTANPVVDISDNLIFKVLDKPIVTNVDNEGADFESALVKNLFNSSSANLGFEIVNVSTGNVVDTLNTVSVDLSNVTLPYKFSDSTTSLAEVEDYEVRAFVEYDSTERRESKKSTFTTKKVIDCSSVSYTGAGTLSNPYKIDSIGTLQCIDRYPDATFEITENIDASSVIFQTATEFSGTILGNGYTVSGLSTAHIGTLDGLIQYVGYRNVDDTPVYNVRTGTLRGCAITNSTIEQSRDNLGSLVSINNGNIVESYTANVKVIDTGTATNIGGLVGKSDGLERDVYTDDVVIENASNNAGGIIGNKQDGTIEDVYSGDVSTVNLTGTEGAVSGSYGSNSTVTNAYYDNQIGITTDSKGTGLTTSEMFGSNATTNMAIDFIDVWVDIPNNYPRLRNAVITKAPSYSDLKVNYTFSIESSSNVLKGLDNLVYDNLRGNRSDDIATVKIGTDGSSNTDTMTALGNAIASLPLDITKSVNTLEFVAVFIANDTEGTTGDIEEIGFFDTSGNLIYRQTIAPLETGTGYTFENEFTFN